MLSFFEADKFLTERTAKEIFYRDVLYIVWAEAAINRQFGHDNLVTLIAALSGPFDESAYDDPAIKELLEWTDYAWDNHWGDAVGRWARKYCKTQQDIAHWNHMYEMIMQKSDDIYEYLNENGQDPMPFDYYFGPFTQFNKNAWPRI